MKDLHVNYMGLDLNSPLIAASSGLTDNIDNLIRFEKFGVGAVVLKSLFEEEIRIEKDSIHASMKSNSFVYPETIEFYDYNQDYDNESTHQYLELVKEAKKKLSIPVIPSINCVTSEQWTFFPRELELAGADGIELNIFIMPSDLNRTREENEKIYFEIIEEVKKQVKIPVAIKISFYFSDLAIMLKRFSETGIKGIVLFNRFYSPDIDIDTLEITSANVLSNPWDFTNSLRWIAIIRDHISCDIAASTGVHDGPSMVKMLLAGAKAVQAATAFYKNGIDYASEMLRFLQTWMNKKGYKKIDDFHGILSQHAVSNPAAFQRVQFMKYFRGHH